MSVAKMSAGGGFRYFADQTVSADRLRRSGESLSSYYALTGCPDGVWMGSGAAHLGVSGTISYAQMENLWGLGLHPDADGIIAERIAAGDHEKVAVRSAQLGRAYPVFSRRHPRLAAMISSGRRAARIRLGRPLERSEDAGVVAEAMKNFARDPHGVQAGEGGRGDSGKPVSRQPVAGFDLTFSVPKSVSVAWALGGPQVARDMEQAHLEGIAAAMSYMESNAALTRRGPNGIAHLDTHGFVAGRFRHWDSRSGDPDLHDHVVIANKVCGSDGKWRALDGRMIYQHTVAGSEIYNRVLAEGLRRRGYQLRHRRPRGKAQPVMELAGVDDALITMFSSRGIGIEARTRQLIDQYRAAHGRDPSWKTEKALRQQANLETRSAKSEATTLEELRRGWRERAGGSLELSVTSQAVRAAEVDVDQVAAQLIDEVSRKRAVWTHADMVAQANRWAAAQDHVIGDDVIDRVMAAAVHDHCVVIDRSVEVPFAAAQVRSSGESVWRDPAVRRYTCVGVLSAEQHLMDACDELVVGAVGAPHLCQALAEAPEYFDQQGRDFVTDLVQRDRLVAVGIGAAGSGKTTAMAVLARAVHLSGHRVHALAEAARTAADLGDGIGADSAETLTSWCEVGRWRDRLGAGDVVVVDEAAMATTFHLDHVVQAARSRGAQVILVGDDRQLSAVGAGGALTLLASHTQPARLETIHRFTDPAEATASLDLGNGSGVSWYADHGRVHAAATDEQLRDQMIAAWLEDRMAGRSAILIADTNDEVTTLNVAAQQHLESVGVLDRRRRRITLADGTRVGPGDRVVTRLNDRRLVASDGRTFVKNRMMWTVEGFGADSQSLVVRDMGGRTVMLPGSYVRRHVELGYAVTNHGAQGMTVDAGHYLTRGRGECSTLYPAMTRGRIRNDVWVLGATTTEAAAEAIAAMAARTRPAEAAHHVIRQALDASRSPAQLIRATRDLANGLDAARWSRALAKAGLSVAGDINRSLVWDQIRRGEEMGLSAKRLATLARAEIGPGRVDATALAAVVGHHVEVARRGWPHRPLAFLTDDAVAKAAEQARRRLAAARDDLAAAMEAANPDPHQLTLASGAVVPSWVERSCGRLSDQRLHDELKAASGQLRALAQMRLDAQGEYRQARRRFSQCHARGDHRSPEARAAAMEATAASDLIDGIDKRRDSVRARRGDLLAESRRRQKMSGAQRAQEEYQRDHWGDAPRTDVIAARGTHAAHLEASRAAWVKAKGLWDPIDAEVQARAHTPDLTSSRRPAWYRPGAGGADPLLSEDHAGHLRAAQKLIDEAIARAGARLARSPQPWCGELGPVPDPGSPLRARWEHLAGLVDTYRDLCGYTHAEKALPAPTAAHPGLPGRVERDLHTLRARMSDMRRDDVGIGWEVLARVRDTDQRRAGVRARLTDQPRLTAPPRRARGSGRDTGRSL